MGMKEIERKFLIDTLALNLPLEYTETILQGYISVDPEIRVRKNIPLVGEPRCYLAIKSKEGLERLEIEKPLTSEEFDALVGEFIPYPLVRKEYLVFDTGDYRLEVSESDGIYKYAEIEFSSVEEATAFEPYDFLGTEVTGSADHKMASYWTRTRLDKEE